MRLKQVLAEHRFSHGSLTPDNILMRRGDAMAIVDYDTAAWPGSPRGRMPNPLPAYRHPSGSAPAVFERRDDFAALVILVSLRALAVDSGMLFPKSLHPEHGMVLSARDLHDPRHSERFRRLSGIDDPETVALAAILAESCQKPVDQTPPFDEVIRAAKAVTGRARRSTRSDTRPIYESHEAPTPVGTLGARDRQLRLTRLNALLMSGADEDALRFWESSGLSDDPVAIDQAGDLVNEARMRIEAAHLRHRRRRLNRLDTIRAAIGALFRPARRWRGSNKGRLRPETVPLRSTSGTTCATFPARHAGRRLCIRSRPIIGRTRFSGRLARMTPGAVLEVVERTDQAGCQFRLPSVRSSGKPAHVRDTPRRHRNTTMSPTGETLPMLARAIRDS
ncbi:MAG: hypothetical protein R2843_01515 [Thermomicrobiales bacterium]